jgi:hypothetical protein
MPIQTPELKMVQEVKAVYAAIGAVSAALSEIGIQKGRKNQQQGFNFRGIDDVYGALSPLLPANGLCIIPRVISRQATERQTKSGGSLTYTVLDVEFDFVSVKDGSSHTARTVGEAMDSADKSSSKAMSAAYKYVAMQVFCIPLEGAPEDRDADFTSHEVRGAREPAPRVVEEKGLSDTSALPPVKNEPVGPETVEQAIERMTANPKARAKLTELLLKAYSVLTLDQIAEDKVQEAIGQAQTCLEAQRKAAAKK